MTEDGFSEARAELFEALGHPMRVRILEALEAKPMGFAKLKKRWESKAAGICKKFHLRKLGGFVKGEDSGVYALSDDGREALRVFRTSAGWTRHRDGQRPLMLSKKRTAARPPGTLAVQMALFLGVRVITLVLIFALAVSLGHLFQLQSLLFPLQGVIGLALIVITEVWDYGAIKTFGEPGGSFWYTHAPAELVTWGPTVGRGTPSTFPSLRTPSLSF